MPQVKEKDVEKMFSRDPAAFVTILPRDLTFGSEYPLLQREDTPLRTEEISKLLKPESTRKIFKILNDLKRGKKRFIHNRTLSLLQKVAAINVAVLPYHMQLYAGNMIIPCQYELNKLQNKRKETWRHHLLAVFGINLLQ